MNLLFTLLLTTPDWINSIAAIAALLTAVITFITVIEIKKQREHSYHPDINIANFEFYVYCYDKDEEDEEDNSMYLYYSKNKMGETEPKTGYNELTIDINNIGLAVAKQVYWYWESDLYEIGKALEQNDERIIDWVIIERDLLVKAKKLNVDWVFSIDEDNSGSFFSFILPYSIENRKNEIRIPQYYLDLYWLYKAKEVTEEFQNNEREYPPLQLHVGYTNIHGKEIQKIFLLYMKWNFMGNPLRI